MILLKIKDICLRCFQNLNKGTTLILGENLDSEGQDSNGAGKTTFIEAITFALFGKIPKGGSVDDVIRTGTKECKVILELQDGDNSIVIERTRGTNNSLKFLVNGRCYYH